MHLSHRLRQLVKTQVVAVSLLGAFVINAVRPLHGRMIWNDIRSDIKELLLILARTAERSFTVVVYHDMLEDKELFDTSEYAQNHPLYSLTNKKVLDKMKDETHGIPIQEFVGLRPKMYSILYTENNKQVEKKTAKGIKKSVTKRKLRHAGYRECLFEKRQTMASMNQIRSESHEIYSIKLNKIGLSPYDDKRYILNDGMNTLAYGHYKTKS